MIKIRRRRKFAKKDILQGVGENRKKSRKLSIQETYYNTTLLM